MFLVTEYVECDLEKIICLNTKLEDFSEKTVTAILYNLLCALKFLHDCKIIHRDIKPANILINSECSIFITDFGLSRKMKQKRAMSPHVYTRYYRAPEVILMQEYNETADIWSLGCILADLLLAK